MYGFLIFISIANSICSLQLDSTKYRLQTDCRLTADHSLIVFRVRKQRDYSCHMLIGMVKTMVSSGLQSAFKCTDHPQNSLRFIGTSYWHVTHAERPPGFLAVHISVHRELFGEHDDVIQKPSFIRSTGQIMQTRSISMLEHSIFESPIIQVTLIAT